MKVRRILLAVLLIAAMLLPGCGQKTQVPELVVPIENPDAVCTARKIKLDTIYAKEGSVCPDVTDIKFDFDSEAYDVQVMIGDYVEIGCNAVCNPGTVIGRHSNVYPTSCVRGVVPENSIWKNNGEVIHKEER